MEHNAEIWQNELKKIANEEKAVILRRFFKTGKGDYGEGDVFIGIFEQKIVKIFNKWNIVQRFGKTN